MYRIDFEYYDKNIGIYTNDSFDIEDNNFKWFLLWLEDNDIINYKITNIEVYTE